MKIYCELGEIKGGNQQQQQQSSKRKENQKEKQMIIQSESTNHLNIFRGKNAEKCIGFMSRKSAYDCLQNGHTRISSHNMFVLGGKAQVKNSQLEESKKPVRVIVHLRTKSKKKQQKMKPLLISLPSTNFRKESVATVSEIINRISQAIASLLCDHEKTTLFSRHFFSIMCPQNINKNQCNVHSLRKNKKNKHKIPTSTSSYNPIGGMITDLSNPSPPLSFTSVDEVANTITFTHISLSSQLNIRLSHQKLNLIVSLTDMQTISVIVKPVPLSFPLSVISFIRRRQQHNLTPENKPDIKHLGNNQVSQHENPKEFKLRSSDLSLEASSIAEDCPPRPNYLLQQNSPQKSALDYLKHLNQIELILSTSGEVDENVNIPKNESYIQSHSCGLNPLNSTDVSLRMELSSNEQICIQIRKKNPSQDIGQFELTPKKKAKLTLPNQKTQSFRGLTNLSTQSFQMQSPPSKSYDRFVADLQQNNQKLLNLNSQIDIFQISDTPNEYQSDFLGSDCEIVKDSISKISSLNSEDTMKQTSEQAYRAKKDKYLCQLYKSKKELKLEKQKLLRRVDDESRRIWDDQSTHNTNTGGSYVTSGGYQNCLTTELRKKIKIHSFLRFLDDSITLNGCPQDIRVRVKSNREEIEHLCILIFIYQKTTKFSTKLYLTALNEITVQMNHKFILSKEEIARFIIDIISLFPKWIQITESSYGILFHVNSCFKFREIRNFFKKI